ncbi:MAG: UbiX family flavin prenyltransferase [Nitrospirae bacterium]|nr:UbiX family flavin prenyltransferase [Nitrospirota bacterium]
MKRIILAITGASGAAYGVRILQALVDSGCHAHVVITTQAFEIIRAETGHDFSGETSAKVTKKLRAAMKSGRIEFHFEQNLGASIASGSFRTDGMIVAPCSMKTLAAIANGYADNLVARAADVCLKEGRRLVLSPREMPFSAIHLENMLKLARLGVKIAPPVPAFYHGVESVSDLVDFVAGRILDAAGVDNEIFRRWG